MDTNPNLNESTSKTLTDFQFSDLFEIEKLQQLQDLFAETHGVASVITNPEGVPITNPSKFTRLCFDIIRKTEKGCANCYKSDAVLGRHHPSGPILQPCLSGGLWDAGASITIGGRHIASWLIGQIRNEEINEQQMLLYAEKIGANQEEFKKALSEVPVMSVKQFNDVAKMLFAFANELSEKAYTNLQLKMQINEREKATELLQESEERFQMLFNKAPLGYQSLDFNGFFIEVNQQWLNLLGYTRQEVIGKWFGDFLSSKYQEGFRKRFPIFKAQGHIHSEFEMVHKNGSKLFIAFDGKIGYSLNGEFKQTHCILQDITQSKQAEEELRKNEQMLQTVLDHFPGIVFWKDKQSFFLGCNKEFATGAGLSNPSEIIGKTDFDMPWSETEAENYRSDDFQVMDSGNAKLHIIEMQHLAENHVIWLNTSKIPLRDSNGQVIGLIGVSTDITERKQAENDLIKSKERAEESDRLKSAFLNNISHEIRTPFNAILGFLAIMQDDDITISERDEYFGIINKSSDRLMNTINDIVEMSKIQTGQVKMIPSETSIKNLISEIFNQYRSDILSQVLTFKINNELPNTIDCLSTDTSKLKTILSNLVGNAIKFTKEGTIELGIRLINEVVNSKDKACHVCAIEFSVKDTGVGIPENIQAQIFDRFIQADVSNTRQFEGLGLGLSITKAYVELLGGKIEVESRVGKGSNFYFTLPYTSEPEVKENIHENNNAEDQKNTAIKLKILIVEDDEASLKFLQLAIKMIGKEIISVKNGVDAVKACRENPDIDLILMDIQMPEMNGYEATRKIREFNTKVIIIAQTAFAQSGDKEKSIEAGCNDYISKPIKKDHILEMVQKYF